MKYQWLYLPTALIWLGASGVALHAHRPGYAALTAASSALNFALFDRFRRQ